MDVSAQLMETVLHNYVTQQQLIHACLTALEHQILPKIVIAQAILNASLDIVHPAILARVHVLEMQDMDLIRMDATALKEVTVHQKHVH